MFYVLTSYLSDKLEYVCCFHNFAYVSYVFYDVDKIHLTLLFNCFFNHLIIDCEFLILHLFTVCY